MTSFKTKSTKVAGSVSKSAGRSSFSVKQPAGDPGWSKTYVKIAPSSSITIKPVSLKTASNFSPISTETIKSRVQSFSMTLSNKPAAPKTQLAKNIQSPTMSLKKPYTGIGQGTTQTGTGSLKVLTAKTSSFKAIKKS